MLARHVVRGREDVPERRPAQDDLAGAGGDAVGEVGLAPGDEGDLARGPARVVQHGGEQWSDDLGLGARRDRLQALGGGIVEPGRGGRRHGGVVLADPSRGLGGRERAPELALVVGGVAELLLAHDDAPQEPVRRMLGGQRDATEHLDGAVGHLARGAGDVGLGDRRRLRGVVGVLVERCRGVQDRRPGARLADVHVGEQVAQRLEAADRPPELAALPGVPAGVVEQATAFAMGLAT